MPSPHDVESFKAQLRHGGFMIKMEGKRHRMHCVLEGLRGEDCNICFYCKKRVTPTDDNAPEECEFWKDRAIE